MTGERDTMFPTEEEKSRETPVARDWRRARTGTDRRGPKQIAIAMLLIFGSMVVLYAADVAGVERRQTTATVVGFIDRWNMRRGHECVIEPTTGHGDAKLYDRHLCHDTPWHLGDTAEVEARQLRFSKAVDTGRVPNVNEPCAKVNRSGRITLDGLAAKSYPRIDCDQKAGVTAPAPFVHEVTAS